MGNARTGFWSAFGALVGGALGATAARYAVAARPHVRYAAQRRASGQQVEDAMVVGGAGGAVLGAFLAGAAAGEPASAPPPSVVVSPR
jgi:hypothetical protein